MRSRGFIWSSGALFCCHSNLMEHSHRALQYTFRQNDTWPLSKLPHLSPDKIYMCLVTQVLLYFFCTRLFSYSSDWSSREVLSNYKLLRKYKKQKKIKPFSASKHAGMLWQLTASLLFDQRQQKMETFFFHAVSSEPNLTIFSLILQNARPLNNLLIMLNNHKP